MLSNPSIWSYGIGFVAFGLFATHLILASGNSRQGRIFIAAIVLSAAWEAGGVVVALSPTVTTLLATHLVDVARMGAWFALLLSLSPAPNGSSPSVRSFPTVALVVGVLVAAASVPFASSTIPTADRATIGALIVTAVLGLFLVERLYRVTANTARWNLKHLYLAIGAGFAFDFALFADAFLFGQLSPAWLSARGLVGALVIPLLSVAAARNRGWSIEIAVTRDLVFRSSALLLSGLYLLATAAVGYYIRDFGGTPGKAAEVALLFGATLGLAVLLLSGASRARLRMWINKHFFQRRYDYREEWLRFTQLLTSSGSTADIGERALVALGDLVESTGGALWLKDDDHKFVQIARVNMPAVTPSEPAGSPLIRVLEAGTILNLDLGASGRGKPPYPQMPEWLRALEKAWLIVPLKLADDLVGFAILAAPRIRFELDWEVEALLATATQQAAGFLIQQRSAEALLEARKFDAFNRMSAFVVHDLKNLVAELALMSKNAERHSANPAFQRDMLETVAHVTTRMQRLLMQLTAGTMPVDKPSTVDLGTVIRRAAAPKSKPHVMLTLALDLDVRAMGHTDRVERVVGHLIQNALDATPPGGEVHVATHADRGFAIVSVKDTGLGMSAEFVQQRLFKPFQTTKEAGMGIGAYETAQYVKSIGGYIAVESKPGAGTCMRMHLPIARQHTPAAAKAQEVA